MPSALADACIIRAGVVQDVFSIYGYKVNLIAQEFWQPAGICKSISWSTHSVSEYGGPSHEVWTLILMVLSVLSITCQRKVVRATYEIPIALPAFSKYNSLFS